MWYNSERLNQSLEYRTPDELYKEMLDKSVFKRGTDVLQGI